ncbi:MULTISPECIES: TonB-dependent receptor [unclassified Halomonas]|uniref:TonB-dependent siderophore receptor n=1 Tax=unclassified Halomonas TaxID=2609666 RepID=UPI0009ED2CB6|nr:MULTISPECIES: TonB-dependent receptor [unclassified Halomonas]MBT2787121.1 TonB-dependent siderophore receptor [Halomonas sp. ISL-106]MBT2795463.1 TonB-dependent siderophore receptor [Halomonas sp. ISL-104]
MPQHRTALPSSSTAISQLPRRRRALALAVHLAAVGLLATPLLSLPAMAQTTQQQTRQYAIPAGPVSTVVNRFASEAGVFISGAGELGEGRQSPGLQGQYGLDEGLERLLNGTRLRAVRQGDGSYRLEERPDGVALSTIEVTGARLPYGMTENSNSYTSESTSIGLASQLVKETPQSVSVVTRERLDDQGTTSLAEAMRNVTGMTVREYGPNQYELKSRGYNINSFLIDGSPAQSPESAWESAGVFDTALLDRIEVLRGPAGILHGSGEPSGTINLVRKRALTESQASVTLSAGTDDAYRGVVDVTGALDSDGRVRGRFVGVYDDRGSFIDNVYSENKVGYGTLEFDLTPDTTLSLGATIQDEEFRPNSGLPIYSDGSLLNVSRSTYLGSDWEKQAGDAQRYFVELEHRLSNGAEITFKANHLNRDSNLQKSESHSSVSTGTGEFLMRRIQWDQERQDDYLEFQARTPFELAGSTHEAVLGTSYLSREVNRTFASGNPITVPASIFSSDHRTSEPPTFDQNPVRSDQASTQYSVYSQANFNLFDPLTLALGGRINWWETETFLSAGGAKSENDSSGSKFIPYAGLIYGLNPEINLYASYTGFFEPQLSTGRNGNFIDPREGDQIEIGIKGSNLEGELNWHVAVFRIEDTNRAYTDPNNPGFSIPIGEARSEGVELEVSGQLLPRWDLSAGYAYTQTEFVKDANSEGLTLSPDTPEHNFNLWSRYRFSDTENQGWRIGAGVNTFSGIYAQSGDIRTEQGGYTTVSALLGYQVSESLDISLNGNNLTDKEYYSTVRGGNRHNYYGAPRNFMLTMDYIF